MHVQDCRQNHSVSGKPRERGGVAVIGAGPSGLVAMRELLDQGLEVTAFEAMADVGGVYLSHYGALQLTSSSATTSFGCHPNGIEAQPVMWRRNEYLDYLASFAARHGLRERIRFGTKVTRVVKVSGGGWWLDWHDGQTAGARHFDRIAICSGVHTEPRIPNIPGLSGFTGRIEHSSTFSSEEDLAGERVLVVGLGESGSDIALLTARSAAAVALSTRKGPGFVVPRLFAGRPTDLDTNRCYHSISRRYSNNPILRWKVRLEHRYLGEQDDREVLERTDEINRVRGRSPFQRFGTKNTSFVEAMLRHGARYLPEIEAIAGRTITFVDGSSFDADRIVFCTGYQARYPFLDACPELAEGAANPRKMYKRMILPAVGDEAVWIGLVRPGFGSIPPMAEMQARYFALLAAGRLKLPSREAMSADVKLEAALDAEQYADDFSAIRPLTDYLRFMDGVAEVIGCRPPLIKLALTKPRLWFKAMFAPICGAQYRLAGPGADTRAAATLLRTPTMPLPVLAYEFAFLAVTKAIGPLAGLLRRRQRRLNLIETASGPNCPAAQSITGG